MTWVGPWQTNDSTEKQLLHGFPLPLPLLPKLEFVLFAQLRRNLLQQEVHAGLSPPAETAYEREEDTFRTAPNTPGGCLRVKMGGDPH